MLTEHLHHIKSGQLVKHWGRSFWFCKGRGGTSCSGHSELLEAKELHTTISMAPWLHRVELLPTNSFIIKHEMVLCTVNISCFSVHFWQSRLLRDVACCIKLEPLYKHLYPNLSVSRGDRHTRGGNKKFRGCSFCRKMDHFTAMCM